MDIGKAMEFYKSNRHGTLVTLRADGSPHVSVVGVAVVGDELWVSVTEDRVKTRNARQDPRVAFIAGTRPWVGVEGTVRFIEGDGVLDHLRTYYREAAGEHPDWEEYDEAMRAERRLLMAFRPARAYGNAE